MSAFSRPAPLTRPARPARPGLLSEHRIVRALQAGGMIRRRADGAALYRRVDARAGCIGDVPRHILSRLIMRGDLVSLPGDHDRLVWPRIPAPPPQIPAPPRAIRAGVKPSAPTALAETLLAAGPSAMRLGTAARRFSHDYHLAARPAPAMVHVRRSGAEPAPAMVAAARLAAIEQAIGVAASRLFERAVVSGASLGVCARERAERPEIVRAALAAALAGLADAYGLTPVSP
jgi:hypothetical protein